VLSNCRRICRSVTGREYSCNKDGCQSTVLWWSLSDHNWHSTRHGGQTKGSTTIIQQSSWFIFQFMLLVPLVSVAELNLSFCQLQLKCQKLFIVHIVLAHAWCYEMLFHFPIWNPYLFVLTVYCFLHYIIIFNSVKYFNNIYIVNILLDLIVHTT
jgi:hypothetical protein